MTNHIALEGKINKIDIKTNSFSKSDVNINKPIVNSIVIDIDSDNSNDVDNKNKGNNNTHNTNDNNVNDNRDNSKNTTLDRVIQELIQT
eukprot:Pgem_evm1s11580